MKDDDQKQSGPYLYGMGFWVALVLSWIGLAGLADNIVEWRDWFEYGVMQHWREVKAFISDELLFWLPFRVPGWVFDVMIVVGASFRVTYMLFLASKSPDGFWSILYKEFKNGDLPDRIVVFLLLFCSPIALMVITYLFYFEKYGPIKESFPKFLKYTIICYGGALVIIFVASDLIRIW